MKKKKILILASLFPPLNTIASHRPYSWAKYWALAGHDVTVLSTKKNIPDVDQLKVDNPGYDLVEVPLPKWVDKSIGKYKKEQEASVGAKTLKSRLLHSFHQFRKERGFLMYYRIPDILDFWIYNAYQRAKQISNIEIVVSTFAPYHTHLIAYFLKHKKLVKYWVADYRDLWISTSYNSGLFPFTYIEKWIEKKILRSCDLLTSVSDPLTAAFKHIPNLPTLTVPNGFDPEIAPNIAEKFFKNNDKLRIVYLGAVYGRRNPRPLFSAIRKIEKDQHRSHLLNQLEVLFYGQNHEEVQTLINEYRVGRWVKSSGMIPHHHSIQIQKEADVLLFLPWYDKEQMGILTGKIYEYLFSKKPILSVGAEEMECSQKLILDAKAGVVCHTDESVEEYLTTALQNPKIINIQSDDQIIQKFTRESIAMNLLQEIEERF